MKKDTVGKQIVSTLENNRADNSLVIDEGNFSLPSIEDFYGDSVPVNFLKEIDKEISKTDNHYDALFYKEDPYSTELGYHPEANVFVIGFNNTKNAVCDDGVADADTVYFRYNEINDGSTGAKNDSFVIEGKSYKSFKEYAGINMDLEKFKKGEFGLRFVGINSPEIPHYINAKSKEEYESNPDFKTVSMTYGKLSKDVGKSNYVIDKTIKRKETDKLFFVQSIKSKDNKWHEIVSDGKTSKMVFIDESDGYGSEKLKQALEAKKVVEQELASAEDIRVVIDAKVINKSSKSAGYNFEYITNTWALIKSIYDFNSKLPELGSWNAPGQEYNKRFLGCIYIKKTIPAEDGSMQSVWINLNKLLISKFDAIETNPNYWNDPLTGNTNNFLADAFKLWTYGGYKNSKIVDSLEAMSSKDIDDRNRIQKEITGLDLTELKDYTVMIGDCLFLVPPTTIRCITQTTSNRIPLLRSKGAMSKGGQRSERKIEMTLYFNEDGINGIPYTTKTPNGENITYHMNGLRALISQFKFTPFLPIENDYINRILNIEAVSLVNIQISTVPQFPKCVAVNLILEEFNYRIYMPEIPLPNPDTDDLNKNLFASSINFEVMRWYYQRPILKGEDLKAYPFNSKEYTSATFGTKTVLQPMDFMSSDIEFYLIDKEYLDRQLQMKLNAMNSPLKTVEVLSDNQKNFMAKMGQFLIDINDSLSNSTSKKLLNNINDGNLCYSIDIGQVSSNKSEDLRSSHLYKQKDNKTISTKEMLTDYINPFLNQFYYPLKTSKNMAISAIESKEGYDRSKSKKLWFYFDICINLKSEYGLTNGFDDIEKMIKYFAEKNPNIDFKEAFVENKLRLGFVIDFSNSNPKFAIDKNLPGYKLLMLCNNNNNDVGSNEDISSESEELDKIGKKFYNNQDELIDRKQSIDREAIDSLKFKKYPIENIKVKNLSCVFGNNFTKMNLEAFDGFAPQFTGGQDTVVEINIQTLDKTAVTMINQLPKVSAEYVRDYKLVIGCWPLRLNSEITRFLGVNEVMVESVDVSTVPGQPGLFNISLRLISVDRTARNKEALKRIDEINNSGPRSDSSKNTVQNKNFFDLKKVLAKAEVYPDLELPTLMELEKAGFKFIKYANVISTRVFPDPDFYFSYSHILGSQIFRDAILKFFTESNKENMNYDLVDINGSKATMSTTNNEKVYDISSTNKIYQDMKKQNEKIDIAVKEMRQNIYQKSKEKSYTGKTYSDIINDLSTTDLFSGWNVGKEIKVIFREKKYENATLDKSNSKCAYELDAQSKQAIAIINDILSKPIEEINNYKVLKNGLFRDWEYSFWNTKSSSIKGQQSEIENGFDKTSRYFVDNTHRFKDLLNALCVPNGGSFNSKLMRLISKLLYSAAASRTGIKECPQDKKDTDWQPRSYVLSEDKIFGKPNLDNKNRIIPICEVENTNQGLAGNYQATDIEDAIKNGTRFGMFGIKKYGSNDIQSMFGVAPKTKKKDYFIDSYYMNLKENDPELIAYKQAIMISPEIASIAFLRNSFVWIKKMLEDRLLLALYDLIQFEVMEDIKKAKAVKIAGFDKEFKEKDLKGNKKNATKEELKKAEELKKEEVEKFNKQEETSKNMLDSIEKIIEENKIPLSLGKFFPAFVMNIIDGDLSLYNKMKERNYDELNSMVLSILSPNTQSSKTSNSSKVFRRFLLALYGTGIIDKITNFADNSNNISDILNRTIGEKVVIERANKPFEYIRDSFLDMIQNDKRGRMCRAFPTYYMLFIDEGREIGYWKLHDNFYNMSAIGEIQVVKSRKIVADTANITMTNLFGSYTEQDTDQKELVGYDLKDAWNSIFSPRTYFLKEELRRTNSTPVDQVRLVPGIRISLRMGYSSDASTLPVLFNGSVAEVGTGEVVQIVAQGDGIETANPIMTDGDAEHFEFEDSVPIVGSTQEALKMGVTPRELMTAILTSKGGFLKKIIKNMTNGRLFNQNPYGLIHLGEQEYKTIFKNGEVVQNIYEALPEASWGIDSEIAENYKTEGAPRISFHTMGKSFWDILNVCASVQPDFIGSIVPFGLRSTIFYGAPRYYYAYDYVKKTNENGESSIKEKRKPFQQYHYYTSFSDIIGNSIVTSEKDVRTCAVGLYTERGWLGKERPKSLSPMFVDFDIYPEKQKTMYYDTQYLAKGSAIGFMLPFANWITNNLADEKGKVQGAKAIAWRMTATALKNSVKEMYQGEVMVIGDPTVKPYDKIWIEDIYNRIQGEAEVEAVVHNLSVNNGFTTSIYPDCVSSVDDRYQQVSSVLSKSMLAKAGAFYGATVMTSMLFANNTRPFIASLAKVLSSGDKYAKPVIDGLGSIIGKEEMINYNGFLKGKDKVFSGMGVNTNKIHTADYLDKLKNFKSRLKNIEVSKSTIEDVAKFYRNLEDIAKDLDPKDTIKTLKESLKTSKNPEAIEKVIKGLNEMDIQKGLSETLKINPESLKELKSVIEKGDKESIKLINKAINSGKLKPNELKKFSETLLKYGTKIDPSDIIKNASTISKGAKTVIANTSKAAVTSGEGIITALIAGGSIGGPIGIVASVIGIMLEMAISYTITSCTQQAATRFLKNLEVLQVYPLMKNGKPLVAGLNGSRGAVVGSGTYEMQGPLQEWIGSFFEDKHGAMGLGWLYNHVRDWFFVNDEMKNIVESWKHKNNFADSSDTSTVGKQNFVHELLKFKAADEMKTLSSIHAMLLQPRVQELNSSEGKEAWKKISVTDINKIGQNKSITENMVPLQFSNQISELRKNSYLTLLHDSNQLKGANKTSRHSVPIEFEINAKKSICNCIYEPNGIIDIPFLRPDAFYLLTEILDRLKSTFEPPTSEVGAKSGFTKHPVVVESCLRVGDNRSWASTGNMFKISVANYPDFLDKISKKDNDLQITKNGNTLIGSSKINGIFFTAKKTNDSSYMFLVHPTKY